MKKTLLFALLCAISFNNYCQKQEKPRPKPPEKTETILQLLAGIVLNFGQVLLNPHNPKIVIPSICSMVAGMLYLPAADRSPKQLSQKDIEASIRTMSQKERQHLYATFRQYLALQDECFRQYLELP